SANVSSNALNLPRPKIVRPGDTVDIYAQQEVLDGDYRYVFLFWSGPGNLRIEQASARVTVNESMTLVANYYVFKRFLDEYYPLYLFVKPSYPELEMPDGSVQRAVALRVQGYNRTLPLQEVPEPILGLVEPVYERYVPYIVTVNSLGMKVELTVNSQPLEVGSSVRLMEREGRTVVIEAPSEAGSLRLRAVVVGGMPFPLMGSSTEVIAFQLSNPVSVELTYTLIPHAFLRDLPLIGGLAYSLTETGYSILRLITQDADEIPFIVALAIPLASVAGSGMGVAYAVRRVARGGLRASIAGGVKVSSIRTRIASIIDRGGPEPDILSVRAELPYESRFQAAPELSELSRRLEELEKAGPEAVEPEEPAEEEAGDEELLDELDELVRAVEEGGKGRFSTSILQLARFDEAYLDAVQSRLRLEPDDTPAIYYSEMSRLVRRVASTPAGLITVSGGDRLLRERVVGKALERAGRRYVRARGLILPPEPVAIGQALKKAAKGADTVVLYGQPPSKALAQAAITSKLLVISVLERGGDIELPPIPDDMIPGVAASLLAERDLIKRLDYTQFSSLISMARSFRGAETVQAFADLLDEGASPDEALDELWAREFKATFPSFEYRVARQIIEKGLSYGEARDLYITAFKQVTAGGDPQASWRRFVSKLERLGVRVGAAQ
ncbi:MAG: hypothetical protein QXD32_00635, partial [Nitrososphaerota archaeon]